MTSFSSWLISWTIATLLILPFQSVFFNVISNMNLKSVCFCFEKIHRSYISPIYIYFLLEAS